MEAVNTEKFVFRIFGAEGDGPSRSCRFRRFPLETVSGSGHSSSGRINPKAVWRFIWHAVPGVEVHACGAEASN
jgi:hypothetical protein